MVSESSGKNNLLSSIPLPSNIMQPERLFQTLKKKSFSYCIFFEVNHHLHVVPVGLKIYLRYLIKGSYIIIHNCLLEFGGFQIFKIRLHPSLLIMSEFSITIAKKMFLGYAKKLVARTNAIFGFLDLLSRSDDVGFWLPLLQDNDA